MTPTSLRFTASTWSELQTVTVSAREDADAANDTATVSHAVSGALGLAGRDVAVTVTDNDEASTGIALTLSPSEVPEGGGARTVTVTAALDRAALAAVSNVVVQVRGGSGPGEASATDFEADPAALTLTIRAGTTEATGTFRLTPDNDSEDEGNGETVAVTGTVSGAGAALPVTGAELTIVDDDGRGLEVSRTELTVTEEDSATYTVRLASLPTGLVRVKVSVADNPDVTVMPADLEFTTASWNVARTVTVSAMDDADGDGETATVTHAASGGGYNGIAGSDVMVTVRDNDQASRTVTLTVDPASVKEDVGRARLTVTAELDGAARSAATEITLAATGGTATSGTDFAALTGDVVTIPANETAASTTVTFMPVNDSVDEGLSETVLLGGTVAGLTVRTATLTIEDDDGRGIELPPGPVTLTEGGDTTYEVTLATQPTGTVTVRVTVSGNRDVTVEPSSLTFTADDWDVAQTVTVSAAHDDDAADDEAELRHAASGADYRGVTALALAVAVTDDDERGVTVSETVLTFREGSEATYTVVLATQPSGTVTVTPTVTGDPDVTVSPARRRFTVVELEDTEDRDGARGPGPRLRTLTIAMVAHAVTGADYGEENVTADDVAVTITDDDFPSTKVTLTVSPDQVPEGAQRTVTVTATLDGAARTEDTVVSVLVTGGNATAGTDFVEVSPFTVTIPATAHTGTGTFTLASVHDAVDETDETVVLQGLATVSGLAVEPVGGLEVTIIDDDTRGVTVTPTALTVLESESATYEVVLQSQPQAVVTVKMLSDSADVMVATPSLTFMPSNWRTAQTVTLDAMNDEDVEDDAMSEVTHTVSGYGGETADPVTVTVPGHEVVEQTVKFKVPDNGEVTVPEGTPVPPGTKVVLPSAAVAGTQILTITPVLSGPELSNPPRGFNAGDTIVDIKLEEGNHAAAGQTATVCLPVPDGDGGGSTATTRNRRRGSNSRSRRTAPPRGLRAG